MPERGLDPNAAGQLALAKALLLFESGDTPGSLSQVKAGIDKLASGGAANLTMVELNTGLGSLQVREGRYEEGVTAYEHAFRMAQRLGNDGHMTKIAGNIALCCVRLGQYADQQQWAALAMMSSAPEVRGYIEIQLAYSTALVHAFCGRPEHAIRVTVDLEAEFAGSLPPWMLQAWTLWKADVLQLSGHHADALAVA